MLNIIGLSSTGCLFECYLMYTIKFFKAVDDTHQVQFLTFWVACSVIERPLVELLDGRKDEVKKSSDEGGEH